MSLSCTRSMLTCAAKMFMTRDRILTKHRHARVFPGSKWVFGAPKKNGLYYRITVISRHLCNFSFLPINNGGNAWGNHFAKIDRLIDWQIVQVYLCTSGCWVISSWPLCPFAHLTVAYWSDKKTGLSTRLLLIKTERGFGCSRLETYYWEHICWHARDEHIFYFFIADFFCLKVRSHQKRNYFFARPNPMKSQRTDAIFSRAARLGRRVDSGAFPAAQFSPLVEIFQLWGSHLATRANRLLCSDETRR